MFLNPYVDGVSVRYPWYLLQPTDADHYLWADLDSIIMNCAAASKMVCLRIGTGGGDVQDNAFGHDAGNKPHWLIQEIQASGDPTDIFFDFYHGAEVNGTPQLAHIPVFWGATKLSRHKAMIQAVAARYRDWPLMSDGTPVVKVFVLNGANASSEDWGIPDSSKIDGIAPAGSTEKSRWRAAGFSAQTIIDLLCASGNNDGLIDMAEAAWTNQAIGVAVNPSGAKIDTNNPLYDSTNPQWICQAVINNARAKFGTKFAPQKNSLNALGGITFPNGQAFDILWSNSPADCQSVWNVSGDAAYRANGGIPDNMHNIIRKMTNTAVACHLSFWEIYENDVVFDWTSVDDPNAVDIVVYGIRTDEIHHAHDQLLQVNSGVPLPVPLPTPSAAPSP